MLTSGVEQKGKAVEIHHHLFDALWNIGSRQIDAAVLVPQEPTDEEEQKQVEECLPITDAPSDTPKVEESKQETEEVQKDYKKKRWRRRKATRLHCHWRIQGWGGRSCRRNGYPYFRSFLSQSHRVSLRQRLALEPSDYMKNNFAEYSCTEFRLNLRQSSFKKIGKLLDLAARDGTIDYELPKLKDHKLIVKVNRDHPR